MFKPLADILQALKAEGVVLYPNNLTKRKATGAGDKESVMDQLAKRELARFDPTQGPRGMWLVEDKAATALRDLAADARPGRPPGQKATLTVEQTRAFLRHLATGAADSPAAVREALMMATGWSSDLVARVELIGLRLPANSPESS